MSSRAFSNHSLFISRQKEFNAKENLAKASVSPIKLSRTLKENTKKKRYMQMGNFQRKIHYDLTGNKSQSIALLKKVKAVSSSYHSTYTGRASYQRMRESWLHDTKEELFSSHLRLTTATILW